MITDEQSKAVQETAKATGTLAELVGKAGAFLVKVIGGSAQEIGEIFTDRIRLFKYKNLCAVADKVEGIHHKRKLEGKTIEIPPRLAIPIFEAAALEDDETLQNVWARLIANSTDPSFKEALHPGYSEVVKQLSVDEATILNSFLAIKTYPVIFSELSGKTYRIAKSLAKAKNLFETKASFHIVSELYNNHCQSLTLKRPSDSKIYMDNLVRLRILELGYIFSNEEDRREVTVQTRKDYEPTGGFVDIVEPQQEEYLKVTPFGLSLISACIADTV